MEKSKRLFMIALIFGWFHFVLFSAIIVGTFVGAGYSTYLIINEKRPIQNIVIVMIVTFAGLTLFGIFEHACNEFIKALKNRDHKMMLMFKLCIIFLCACAFGVFCCGLYRLYIQHELTEKFTLIYLIGGSFISVFEFIVFVVTNGLSKKIRFEKRRQREEKYRKRKINAVSQQMSNILQPIDIEDGIEEKFEKTQFERKQVAWVQNIEDLPPPPDNF
ncbi:hypothetical protein PVAND_005457 [Polypedilum vanderplanki]|uniref:Transmembrane protein n=1 Tax=Polypedilum vanderplanki TaxID=319348 RepID=A0A9J6C0N4_POLVA|nr:hypothetical protein PVAND_005457 [Polypedilum vanderplanki]